MRVVVEKLQVVKVIERKGGIGSTQHNIDRVQEKEWKEALPAALGAREKGKPGEFNEVQVWERKRRKQKKGTESGSTHGKTLQKKDTKIWLVLNTLIARFEYIFCYYFSIVLSYHDGV